nr:lysosomal Pro-X carboxypeptidase-like [Ipomoea batatas]GMC84405.1 lysosomal Pro-X carboxypeptidase-like [Ipomoea batatas]
MNSRILLLLFFSYCAISFAKTTPTFPFPFPSIIKPDGFSAASTNTTQLYDTKYFTQILDHFTFTPQSYQTFQQRYLINYKYWGGAKNMAPIFVYMGGEADIESFAQNTGFMFDIAPHFNALLVFIETEVPTREYVTIGALASSAPILYFDNITSPYAFNDIITQDFRSESENCYKVIKSSWQFIEEIAKQADGLEILRKSFRICNADSLEDWLSTAYFYTAMTDNPTAANLLNPLPPYPIKQMCKAIDDPRHGSDILEKLYAAVNIFYNYTGKINCFDPEKPSQLLLRSAVQWRWQSCTEMIIPTGSSSKDSIFPAWEWDYSEEAKICKNAFNIEPRPNWITTEFGGHNIKRVLKRFGSNIILFNGLRDPWSSGGVLENISKSIVAIVAKEG